MSHDDPGPGCTADEALARLVAGNARFVAGQAKFPTIQQELLASLTGGQRPYATILGCSDSRVPPELVFDAGFGELFIIRVAGNVLGPTIAGTLQYAGTHLRTPLIVVMGHDRCGAVEAALAARREGVVHRSRIATLLEWIEPALDMVDLGLPPEARLRAAVEANVRWTLKALRESPEGQSRLAEGRMKLVGAVYQLETGRVRFLEE